MEIENGIETSIEVDSMPVLSDSQTVSLSPSNEISVEADSVPSLSVEQTVSSSPSFFEDGSVKDYSMDLDILDFEEELLGPSFEVAPSLSVCGNIHQARFFPFWEDVLKCGPWHKKILKEGLKLDFIDGILPEAYEERNNKLSLIHI